MLTRNKLPIVSLATIWKFTPKSSKTKNNLGGNMQGALSPRSILSERELDPKLC